MSHKHLPQIQVPPQEPVFYVIKSDIPSQTFVIKLQIPRDFERVLEGNKNPPLSGWEWNGAIFFVPENRGKRPRVIFCEESWIGASNKATIQCFVRSRKDPLFLKDHHTSTWTQHLREKAVCKFSLSFLLTEPFIFSKINFFFVIYCCYFEGEGGYDFSSPLPSFTFRKLLCHKKHWVVFQPSF